MSDKISLDEWLALHAVPLSPSFDKSIQRFGEKEHRWLFSVEDGEFRLVKIGDWRSGEEFQWVSGSADHGDEDARREALARRAEFKRINDAEILEAQTKAAAAAVSLWSKSVPRGTHPYLDRKKIQLHCARISVSGVLRVPMWDEDLNLAGLQSIDADGTKRFLSGQRVLGLACVISELPICDSEVLICEGFATGASLHEATGLPVVVTFTAANMIVVAERLRKFNLTVCGDDDKWGKMNTGRKACEAIIERGYAKRFFLPRFKDESDAPTDFNDLHVKEGLDAVRQVFHVEQKAEGDAVEQPKVFHVEQNVGGAVIDAMDKKVEAEWMEPLGHLDTTYFYTSSENKQVITLGGGGHVPGQLYMIMPKPYWVKRFGNEEGKVDWGDVASQLMQSCHRKGLYDPNKIRGRGCWRHDDKLLIHFGDKIYYDGNFFHLAEMKSRYVYRAALALPPLHASPLTALEGSQLRAACEGLSWTEKKSGGLLAGFLSVMRISGAMAWRPHAWITGAAGSGKSTVLDQLVHRLGGEWSENVLGNSSEAGIRQALGDDSRPVIFDEAERNDARSSSRVRSVIELARLASTPGNARVIKGTPGGKPLSFRADGSFVLSSIRVSLEEEADFTRFQVFELARDKKDDWQTVALALKPITGEYAERLFARMVKLFPALDESYWTLHTVLSGRMTAREAQLAASLLCGLWILENDRALSPKEADALGWEFYSEKKGALGNSDEWDCLDHLMQSVTYHETITGRERVQFADLIRGCDGKSHQNNPPKEQLELHGVSVSEGRLFISHKNPELEKVYRDTRWHKVWSQSLSRLPGVSKGRVLFKSGNKPSGIFVTLEVAFTERLGH